jgi:hypothetical protein
MNYTPIYKQLQHGEAAGHLKKNRISGKMHLIDELKY